MNEPKQVLANGTRITTHIDLDSTSGLLIKQDLLDNRERGVNGVICGIVGGHGGDFYWVKHEDGVKSAYGWMEFELIESIDIMNNRSYLDIAIEALQNVLTATDPSDMVSGAAYALGLMDAPLPEGADGLGEDGYIRGQGAR